MKSHKQSLVIPQELNPGPEVLKRVEEFIESFKIYEIRKGLPTLLLIDKKSMAFYMNCHLESRAIAINSDLEAVLEANESEDYKLNRNIYADNYAYKVMEKDALGGRSFEDLVVEYDTLYRPNKPLKVFGGQHRITAIIEATKKNVNTIHGVRVYFGLSAEQRFNIAVANNTSITVSNDLLDRMQEDLLGPNLRDWCQSVSMLNKGQNFADTRSPEGIPTVRIARTLIVNFYLGKKAQKDVIHIPVVCSTGPKLDGGYTEVRNDIVWSDKALKEMGVQFTKLHMTQRQTVLTRRTDKYLEFANKAMHPCVAASWAYTVGLLQDDPEAIKGHYDLTDSTSPPNDPLNAKALSTARLKGVDPDTYRGLGARINSDELGRMFQVFFLQATKAAKRGITPKLAEAAIQTYVASKAQLKADKAVKGI